jgi:hypothetical protein
MKKIFDANNSIEANLLKNILEQEGIGVYISGEYLQGGMGELPAMGLVSLMVEDDDVYRAERIIRNWERGDYAISE